MPSIMDFAPGDYVWLLSAENDVTNRAKQAKIISANGSVVTLRTTDNATVAVGASQMLHPLTSAGFDHHIQSDRYFASSEILDDNFQRGCCLYRLRDGVAFQVPASSCGLRV